MSRRNPFNDPRYEIAREAMIRLKNRAAVERETGVPRTTLCSWFPDIWGSPNGGGFNPHHRNTFQSKQEFAAAALPVEDAVKSVVEPEPEPEPDPIKRIECGDEATIEFKTDKPIITLEDAIAYAAVDLQTWFVYKWEATGWQVPVKVSLGQDANRRWRGDSPHVKQMWRVRIELRRIQPKPYLEAIDAIFKRLADHAPAYRAIRHAPPKVPHLLELDIFDTHFGKLAWAAETGESYDLKIAERIYRDAVEDLLNYASGFEIEQILFPIGNDFFHVDGLESATTAGTRVDSDGRFAKIVEVGEASIIWAVEYLMQVAPVKVIWVPGNHDRLASYNLCRVLSAWFRNTDAVEVDRSPKVRKYVRYGINLIGYTHGDKERPNSLPVTMATEEPILWSETTHREFHTGHFHKSKRAMTPSVDTHDGIAVRTLMSLSARDAWHYTSGYVGGRRAAEAFVMAKDRPMTVNFQVPLRQPI